MGLIVDKFYVDLCGYGVVPRWVYVWATFGFWPPVGPFTFMPPNRLDYPFSPFPTSKSCNNYF